MITIVKKEAKIEGKTDGKRSRVGPDALRFLGVLEMIG